VPFFGRTIAWLVVKLHRIEMLLASKECLSRAFLSAISGRSHTAITLKLTCGNHGRFAPANKRCQFCTACAMVE